MPILTPTITVRLLSQEVKSFTYNDSEFTNHRVEIKSVDAKIEIYSTEELDSLIASLSATSNYIKEQKLQKGGPSGHN